LHAKCLKGRESKESLRREKEWSVKRCGDNRPKERTGKKSYRFMTRCSNLPSRGNEKKGENAGGKFGVRKKSQ